MYLKFETRGVNATVGKSGAGNSIMILILSNVIDTDDLFEPSL